jgi:hypothetical protein
MIFVVTEVSSLGSRERPGSPASAIRDAVWSRRYVDVTGAGPPLPVAGVAGWGTPDGNPSDGMSDGYTS